MAEIERAPQLTDEIVGPLLSAAEIAHLFKVHPSTIRRLAREGKIPSYLVGSTPRFVANEVAACFRKESTSKRAPLIVAPRPAPHGQPVRPLERAQLRRELFTG